MTPSLREALAALSAFVRWGDQQCPCHDEQPNPCPLCGASVENGEACKAADEKFPPQLLEAARRCLEAGPVETPSVHQGAAVAESPEAADEDRWISVTERLPEGHERVVAAFRGRIDGKLWVCQSTLMYGDGYWNYEGDVYTGAVTHWMPLPSPPTASGL